SMPEEVCQDIEIVDGMVRVSLSPTTRHNRLAKLLSIAIEDGAGADWHADIGFDVRLQDVPLLNRRPDVTVYRAEALDIVPKRPEHVLLLVEIVSPGSESADRDHKPFEYAEAGIQYYWRVEEVGIGVPVLHTFVLDTAARSYVADEVFTGLLK